ncbi:hypothetical protein ADK52_25490 [Streptomyces sp. WM6372]|uniref:hypothetical protein n=1 Tax=Streptomyces sp. WM6372 TaxID=1415555 RepID=UPI0006ADE25E|nr:hypothetical protein [Streptomyces sp. WM6372]KOU20944.1 hypothetical protein ADK52_25490 [Streptomyces sp. WM6372]
MGWSKAAQRVEKAVTDALANGATPEEATEAGRRVAAGYTAEELGDGMLSLAVDIRADYDAKRRNR